MFYLIYLKYDFKWNDFSVTTSFQCIRDAPRMTGGAGSVDQSGGNGNDSSESETENNDDLGTSVKFLLLVHFIYSSLINI